MSSTSPASARTLLRRKPDVPWRRLGEGRGMLLDLDSGNYFELGGTAPALWTALDGTADTAAIAKRFAAATGCDATDVQRDVEAFVDQLEVLGLLSGDGAALEEDDVDGGALAGPWTAPTIASKGNLKFLGQLD